MDRTTLKNTYLQRKESFETLLKRQINLLTAISILRLSVIILAIWFVVLGVKNGQPLLYIVALLMAILFFTLVIYHKNQNDKRKLLLQLIAVNVTELDALDNHFAKNPDGRSFSNPEHPWSYDLDLFGEGSLFQFINRTATHPGPQKLAGFLTSAETDEKELKHRQEIIKELSEKLNLRQHFTANAGLMDISDDDYSEVIAWSDTSSFIESYRWTKIMPVVMMFVSGGIILAGIISSGFFRLLIPVVILNFFLLSPFLMRTNRYQAKVSKKHSFLKTYSILLDLLAKEEFEHPRLREMKENCISGSGEIRKLSGLLDLFDQRLNLLMGSVLNGLFLFDFFMLHRLAAWNNEHKDDFKKWLNITGTCDALFSLSGFAFNHPANIYPQIEEDYTGLLAEDLGHPMIPSEKRVSNSIEITSEKVIVITGANMAGKSTFLRSLGVNMVLAYAGCPVCAAKFRTGNYQLYSSMRTSDSLKDEESYFFAEIKRLKVIVEQMKEGRKMLILLDEVLKGTNTTDKQKGSKGLIEKSVNYNVLCFIATHDLSLGELKDKHQGTIANYCFESYINGLELTFDYKIMAGLAKNMNASFLMKQMGIMD